VYVSLSPPPNFLPILNTVGIKHSKMLAEDVFGVGWGKTGAMIYEYGVRRGSVWGFAQHVSPFPYPFLPNLTI
jgi:hypothetical protein